MLHVYSCMCTTACIPGRVLFAQLQTGCFPHKEEKIREHSVVQTLGLLDFSNMCVEQQRWASTESSFGDPISFRAPDVSVRVLLLILPRVYDLECDSLHPIRMKNARRAFDALCEHSIIDDAGRPIDRFSQIGARITRNIKAPSA